jgi:hypothetical protein
MYAKYTYIRGLTNDALTGQGNQCFWVYQLSILLEMTVVMFRFCKYLWFRPHFSVKPA